MVCRFLVLAAFAVFGLVAASIIVLLLSLAVCIVIQRLS